MKDGVESLGRVRAKGIAILLLTFLVGGLAGAALERARASRSAPEPTTRGWEARPGAFRPGRLPPAFGRLGLTDEQRARISEIMEQAWPQTEEIMSEMLPRLRAVTDSIHDEIRAVLTPEQAAKLDSLLPRGRFRTGPGRPGMRRRDREGPPPPLYWDPSQFHLPQ